MTYFSLTFLAAYSVVKVLPQKGAKGWMKGLIALIGGVLSLLIMGLPLVDKYKEAIIASDSIKDPFAVANLQAKVEWSGLEFLLGLFFLVSIIAALVMMRKKLKPALLLLSISSLITINLFTVIFIPKIEQYSQGAAIRFYESKVNEDCYVIPYGYKSYAHLFYTQKQPQDNPDHRNPDWLYKGDIDKTCYFVSKITKKKKIEKEFPQWEFLGEENGFVFYKRSPKP